MSMAVSDWIHPTAVIGPEAELAPDVQVGAYAVIEGFVQVGPGCIIDSHSSLSGPLIMGRDNTVCHGAVLGKSPQHRGYRGESTVLRIGDGNTFREHVTVHRGTVEGGGETRIGNNNLFMVSSHIGHDCKVGSNVTLVNGALVAGHVKLYDSCILSGHTAVQQRVRIGRLAMLSGLGSSSKDIPPFILQQGYNCVTGLNIVGLRRSGFAPETIAALRASFRILYKEGRPLGAALGRIEMDFGSVPEVRELVEFVQASTVGINPVRDAGRLRRVE
jgi:UDP-N-acetylglucosamine acyltransferase